MWHSILSEVILWIFPRIDQYLGRRRLGGVEGERSGAGGGGGEDGKGSNHLTDQQGFSQGPVIDLSGVVEL